MSTQMFMMTHGRFDVSWVRLSKPIGSLSLRYQHGLVNGLVDDETVAHCIIVNL